MISGGPCHPPPAWDSVTCGGCHMGLPAECPVSDVPQLCVTAAFRPHVAQHSWNSTLSTLLKIALPEDWWVSSNYRASGTSKGVLEYSPFLLGRGDLSWLGSAGFGNRFLPPQYSVLFLLSPPRSAVSANRLSRSLAWQLLPLCVVVGPG